MTAPFTTYSIRRGLFGSTVLTAAQAGEAFRDLPFEEARQGATVFVAVTQAEYESLRHQLAELREEVEEIRRIRSEASKRAWETRKAARLTVIEGGGS